MLTGTWDLCSGKWWERLARRKGEIARCKGCCIRRLPAARVDWLTQSEPKVGEYRLVAGT